MLRMEEQQEGRTWVRDDDTQLPICGGKSIFLIHKLPWIGFLLLTAKHLLSGSRSKKGNRVILVQGNFQQI